VDCDNDEEIRMCRRPMPDATEHRGF
jgi:hypothetical protein